MQLVNKVPEGSKSKQSYANTRISGKEQYYTNESTVDVCLQVLMDEGIDLSGRTVLEPCGGTGEFIEGLKKLKIKDLEIISCDIEPKHPDVVKADYLKDDPIFKNGKKLSDYSNLICITNPPFGRNSQLATRFFKKAAENCEYICYIVPKSWRKYSIINRLPENYELIADKELPSDSFYLSDGSRRDEGVLQTVFQIWRRNRHPRPKIKIPDYGLIKRIQPVKRKVYVYREVKEEVFKKDGNKFIPVTQTYYTRDDKRQSRPMYVMGANFSIIYAGAGVGKCERIKEDVIDANTAVMYLYIKEEKYMKALEKMDFSELASDSAYVDSLSIDHINRKLNKEFGLKTQDLSWLEDIWENSK